jgi:YbbR domain-containing protein
MKMLNKTLQLAADLRRLPGLWPKDWTLPFISLALAVTLWYFVGGDDTVDKNVMVPVDVINLPRDLVISNQYKREVLATISGPRKQVLNIEQGDLTRQVDLFQAVPGTMVIKNENNSISVPRGVKVLRIQPDSIILSLGKLIQKQLPVKAVTKGHPAVRFDLQGVSTKPESISVIGPQTVLSQIESLQTQVIDISGLTQPTQLQVPLVLNADLLELIGETSVTAELNIVEETVEKRIFGLPIELGNYVKARQVTPSTVTVTAALPRSLARGNMELQSLFTVTAVDDNQVGKMTVKVTTRDNVPKTVQVVNVEPKVVTYTEVKQDALPPLPRKSGAPLKE